MQLSRFIRENEEQILEEWAAFARSLESAPGEMDSDELRDHARGMLQFIAAGLESPEKGEQMRTRWRAEDTDGRHSTAAEAHGGDRVSWGFSINDMVAEFRALRASVMRLWGEQDEPMDPAELVQFNEAIDRELADSLAHFLNQYQHRNHLLESMLAWSPDHSYVFDPHGCILYANRAFAEAYGKHPAQIIGKPVDTLDDVLAEEVHRQIEQVRSTGREYRGDFTSTTGRGEAHVVEYLFAPVFGDGGRIEAIAGNSRDITARKAWEHTLWKYANHDHLTGVPNRRLFLDRLEQDIRLAKRSHGLLALLYVDLDGFKSANDRLGHDAGDMLLKQTAERIAACIRETDTVARMGGDEFTVILVDAGDENHVAAVARAILTRLSRPFVVDHENTRISASIGIALYPQHGETVEDMTHNADQAMYAAKNSGGDALRFFSSGERTQPRPVVHEGRRPH